MKDEAADPLLVELRKLGRYTRIEPIAAGAMGRIYRAYDTQTTRDVAIKVLAPEARKRTQAVVRFREEVCAAAKLRDTHVVTLYDSGEVGDTLFYVMEYVEGVPLDRFVEKNAPPLRERAALILSVARGVEAMHAADIIHRDLKPDNILVTGKGLPIIIDLGVAKRVAATDRSVETLAGTSLGTPLYMPPEQVRYDPDRVGKPSDVYSLGVLSYQVLTGRYPYDAANRALGLGVERDTSLEADGVGVLFGEILEDPPIPPRTFMEDFPPGLERVLLRALAKEPEDRYAHAGEYADAIESWLRPQAALRRTGPRATREMRPVRGTFRRHRVAWLAAGGLVLGLAAAVAIWSLRPGDDPALRAPIEEFGREIQATPSEAWEAWLGTEDRDTSLDEPFRRLALAASIRRERFPRDDGLEALFLAVLERLSSGDGDAVRPSIEAFLRNLADREVLEAERHLADRRYESILPILREVLAYRPEHAESLLEADRMPAEILTRAGWAVVDAACSGVEPAASPDAGGIEIAIRLYRRAVREGDDFARRDLAIAHLLLGRPELAAEDVQAAAASDFLLPATAAWIDLARGDPAAAQAKLDARGPSDRRWLDWFVAGLLAEAEGKPDQAAACHARALEDPWYLRPLIEGRYRAIRP